MTNHHHPEIANAKKDFESYKKWLESTSWGASSIDLYVAGMIVRATETMESMFYNASGSPDNTLTILSRNLFETVVRVRYLAQDPENRISEFHLDDIRGRLGIIGEEDKPDDTDERRNKRANLKSQRDIYKEKVKDLYQVDKPPKLSVIRMCGVIAESDNYVIYRILSQYEHSMGMGIVGSVIDKNTKKIVYGKQMDEGQAKLVWEFLQSHIKGIKEAVSMLNSHRPE